jgi:hypothetical protein
MERLGRQMINAEKEVEIQASKYASQWSDRLADRLRQETLDKLHSNRLAGVFTPFSVVEGAIISAGVRVSYGSVPDIATHFRLSETEDMMITINAHSHKLTIPAYPGAQLEPGSHATKQGFIVNSSGQITHWLKSQVKVRRSVDAYSIAEQMKAEFVAEIGSLLQRTFTTSMMG